MSSAPSQAWWGNRKNKLVKYTCIVLVNLYSQKTRPDLRGLDWMLVLSCSSYVGSILDGNPKRDGYVFHG
jgi:hypothetical protein